MRNKKLICITVTTSILTFLLLYGLYQLPWNSWVKGNEAWASWAVVMSTLIAPLFAIQATRYLDKKNDERKEKLKIFYGLLSCRNGEFASSVFIENINLVGVRFSSETGVIDALYAYSECLKKISHFEDLTDEKSKLLNDERKNALNNLLHAIAVSLGIRVGIESIRSNGFWPDWITSKIMTEKKTLELNYLLLKDHWEKTDAQNKSSSPDNLKVKATSISEHPDEAHFVK